ncbi:MarR family winged helix-turn-helix transcriptional regulator [Kribbella sp. CA-247076]|uniref:MarR family winged helix-turn-helix transcriptional regulator n=1 Tax=Kribbella sp. CA-247076 TaxID=3239941 RepID=UPI003D9088AE
MSESNLWAAWTLRSHDALTAAVSAAAPPGLALRDLAALTLIASHAGCSADWLWSRIGLTQSGTVRLIDRLERLGYVDRVRRGRVLELSLTASGQELLATWNAARDQAGRDVLDALTPEERRRFNDLLATALRRTSRERSEADTTCRLCNWPICTNCPVDKSVTQPTDAPDGSAGGVGGGGP